MTRIAAISAAAPTRPGTSATSAAVPSTVMAATFVTCGLPGTVSVKVNEPAPRMPRMNFFGISQRSKMTSAIGYMSTMTTPAMMPPRLRMVPMTRITDMPMRFLPVLLMFSLSRRFMTVSAMV